MPSSDLAATIHTRRLDLVLLTRGWLDAYVAGDTLPDLGFDDPDQVLRGSEGLVRMRIAQLDADPSEEPWLLRMLVVRGTGRGRAIGYANFQTAGPDEGGAGWGRDRGTGWRRTCGGRATRRKRPPRCGSWAGRHGARVLRGQHRAAQRALESRWCAAPVSGRWGSRSTTSTAWR